MGRAGQIDPELNGWLLNQSLSIKTRHRIGGGCIAESYQLWLSDDSCLFVKQMNPPIAGMFAAEKLGLEALSQGALITAPQPCFQNEHCLVMPFIQSATPVPEFDELLGRQLAQLHKQPQPCFGFERDTFCGATRQPNVYTQDGFEFYSQQRFLYLGTRCYENKLLNSSDLQAIEQLCQRLEVLVPPQPPSLLHGDLWRGNVHVDGQGKPVLIDPAVYYGWAEAELAMTRLFGGFSPAFYHAYNEINPMEPGWEARLGLYNLWHLLNHLLLFGESYLYDVRQVFRQYG